MTNTERSFAVEPTGLVRLVTLTDGTTQWDRLLVVEWTPGKWWLVTESSRQTFTPVVGPMTRGEAHARAPEHGVVRAYNERRTHDAAWRDNVVIAAFGVLGTWHGDCHAAAMCAERVRDRPHQPRLAFWTDVAILLNRRADTMAGCRT